MTLDLSHDLAATQASVDRGQQFNMFLSFWLSGIVYGLYLVLFVILVRITPKRPAARATSANIFTAGTYLMLILVSIWMGITFHRFLYAFGPDYSEASGMLPIYYLRNYTTWDNFASIVLVDLLVWLADALVIYRCFLIWNRNYWVIAVPILVLVLSVGNGIVILVWFKHPSIVARPKILPLLVMVYPINISQSCMTTGLITLKIWRQHVRSRRAGLNVGGNVNLITVIRIIIESAMIFTVQQLILLILYLVDSPVQFAFHGTFVPSIGIVFLLMAIRAYTATRNSCSFRLPPPSVFRTGPTSTPYRMTPANMAVRPRRNSLPSVLVGIGSGREIVMNSSSGTLERVEDS